MGCSNKIGKRRFLVLLLALAMAVPAAAKRGDDRERRSKNGHLEGEVGSVTVVVDYGRPQVRGRAIWGGLVPWGQVWRTGADEATTIELSGDLLVEDQALAAGRYALFTIPGEDRWTVVFNRAADQWGAFGYDSAEDALRVTVIPRSGPHVEQMEFGLEGGELVLAWGELEVPIRLAPAGD